MRLLLLLAFALPAPVVAAQQSRGDGPQPRSIPSLFRIEAEAGRTLRDLWDASHAAREERVACLGGYRQGAITVIERVQELRANSADSLGIAAGESIETCGPPDWLGTVHTHVALHEGSRPSASFSGADRGVMWLWWKRWRADGVFCVLYSVREAHCEVEGLNRSAVGGPETNLNY
jgi:hypothetical protein